MKHWLWLRDEIDAVLCGKERILIGCDFDGTLCPLAATPAQVELAPTTFAILRRAAECRRLTLAVISGRALNDIRRLLPLDHLVFAGNHGLEIVGRGLEFSNYGAQQLRSSLSSACEALTCVLQAWPAAWIEDKHLSLTLHFRQVDEAQQSSLRSAARRALAGLGRSISLFAGKRALEIRPNVPWDKGAALKYIRQKLGPFDACICLGDDRTDESMFRANRGQLSIRVGRPERSAATCYLSGPDEVAAMLAHLVEVCSSDATAALMTNCKPSPRLPRLTALNHGQR